MKKFLLFFALCVTHSAFSQSQRLPLIEELTSASCPPSYVDDGPLNNLLLQNTAKVRSAKFEVNWPSPDVLYNQDATDVNARVMYYSCNAVPACYTDGGASVLPYVINQQYIDSVYAIPSPFDMNVTHNFNPANDSIFITVNVVCSQSVNMNNAKLRVAIEEEHIHFNAPISTTPMTDFYYQVRKMVPGANGTSIANSWVNSQSQTFTFAVPLPVYIYSLGQVSVLAWIQDDGNKDVKQSAYSVPLPVSLDAGITSINGIPTASCSGIISPSAVIHNFGTSALNTCLVNFIVDNGPVQSFSWSGNLAPNASASMVLPQQILAPGYHVLHCSTSMPNAANDQDAVNDMVSFSTDVFGNVAPAPFAENFSTNVLTNAPWIIHNGGNGVYNATWSWTSLTGAYTNPPYGCAKLDFFNSQASAIDEMLLPPLDLSALSGINYLTFDMAHADYDSTYVDTLDVDVSTDCGLTWTTLYHKFRNTLNTAPDVLTQFTPSSSQWRFETVDISAYNGLPSVIIKFSGHSGYGNALYIDNINVGSAMGVEDIDKDAGANVFPNPFYERSSIRLKDASVRDAVLELYDVIGNKLRCEKMVNGELQVQRGDLPPGIYFYKITSGEKVIATGKLIAE
ncbi:MAG TPA: T9SS type A sorting domain-containing protein [Bacteroidia bacterium]|jgi:hypothetical protein